MKTVDEVKALFAYEHLPEHLKAVSVPFYDLAVDIFLYLGTSAETTLCMRKLWEAKNYAVWVAAQPDE